MAKRKPMERTPRAKALADEMLAKAKKVTKTIRVCGREIEAKVTVLPAFNPAGMRVSTEHVDFAETMNVVSKGSFGPVKE